MTQILRTPSKVQTMPLGTETTNAEVEMLPPDIVLAAVKCADAQRAHKAMLSNDEAYAEISRRLGWK